MPLYEYECSVCKKVIEKLTSDYEQIQITCDCNKKSPCNRIISTQSKSILNGTGFYETDYKKK
jgi:putative FmdB family regulatory protein